MQPKFRRHLRRTWRVPGVLYKPTDPPDGSFIDSFTVDGREGLRHRQENALLRKSFVLRFLSSLIGLVDTCEDNIFPVLADPESGGQIYSAFTAVCATFTMPDEHIPGSDGQPVLSEQSAIPIVDHDPDRANNDNILPFGLANDVPSVVPVWLSESSKSFRWGWVPLPLRKAGRATVKWLKGPDPPHNLRFEPLLPSIQEAPVLFLEQYFPKRKQKIFLLLGLYFAWFLSWGLILRHSASSGHIEGYGIPSPIGCSANYW